MAAHNIVLTEMRQNRLPGRFWSWKRYCDNICSSAHAGQDIKIMPRILGTRGQSVKSLTGNCCIKAIHQTSSCQEKLGHIWQPNYM